MSGPRMIARALASERQLPCRPSVRQQGTRDALNSVDINEEWGLNDYNYIALWWPCVVLAYTRAWPDAEIDRASDVRKATQARQKPEMT